MLSGNHPGGNLGILPVCADLDTLRRLREFAARALGLTVVPECHSYAAAEREAQTRLESFAQRVCLVDLDQDIEQAIKTAERISEHMGGFVSIFAVSADADPQAIIRVMRAGCSEYFIKPLSQEKLGDALDRLESKRRAPQNVNAGKLITVLGAKGGSGVTSIALHVAVDLADRKRHKTLLIDQHASLGDVSLYGGLSRHQYNFYELVNNTDRIDAELVKGFVLTHESGLDVLDSPEAMGSVNHAPPEYVDHTMDFLKSVYSYIVVDCPPGLNDEAIATVRHSDYIFLVMTAEMPAIRNSLRYIEHLNKLEFPEDRVRVVLNRHDKLSQISDDQVDRALRKKVSIRVPNSFAEVSKAINAGTPITAAANTDYSNAIVALTDSIAKAGSKARTPQADAKRGGLLGALGF